MFQASLHLTIGARSGRHGSRGLAGLTDYGHYEFIDCLAADFCLVTGWEEMFGKMRRSCHVITAELRCDSAFAMQNRILHSLQVDESPIFLEAGHWMLDSALISHFLAKWHNGFGSAEGRRRHPGWLERPKQ